jgi:DNA-binding MarR family transcriptional regulator
MTAFPAQSPEIHALRAGKRWNQTSMNKDPNSMMDRDNQLILTLLTALEDDPTLTQKDLATRLGVAVGMVNSYIKRVVYKGYVKTKHMQRRRLKYLLTAAGIKEKSRLTYEFLTWSYQYIYLVREKVKAILTPLVLDGHRRIVIYGSGEVTELAYLVLCELKAELVAIIDPENEGKRCIGYNILSWEQAESLEDFDIILILTKYRNTDDENKIAEIEETRNCQKIESFQ